MRFFSLKRFGLLIVLVVAVGLFIFITNHAQAITPVIADTSNAPTSPNWALLEDVSASPELVVTPPPPSQDSCLSCHILGQNKGLWTPLARWLLFGSLGLVFVFGVYRSANTWVTRSPRKSFTTRAADWVEDRYHISEPLTKVLKKPVPKYAQRWQ